MDSDRPEAATPGSTKAHLRWRTTLARQPGMLHGVGQIGPSMLDEPAFEKACADSASEGILVQRIDRCVTRLRHARGPI
jgi:hypothetical protein